MANKRYNKLVEKEEELIKRFKEQGDKKTRDELVKITQPYVCSIARGYIKDDFIYFDLVQEGNLGLLNAISKYDYKKGQKFLNYAGWKIKRYMLSALREETKKGFEMPIGKTPKIISLDEIQTIPDPNHLLEEYSIEKEMYKKELSEILKREIKKIEKSKDKKIKQLKNPSLGEKRKQTAKKKKKILKMILEEKLTGKEIGERLHMGESNVSLIYTEYKRDLKKSNELRELYKEFYQFINP